MEGAPLTSASESEHQSDSDEKDKKKRPDILRLTTNKDMSRQRHVAQEALKMQQREKVSDEKNEHAEEAPDQELSSDERIYAAQIIRRENRTERHDIPSDPEAPAAITAGDVLVEEWDDRIESGEDFDAAFQAIIAGYSLELGSDNEHPDQQAHEDAVYISEDEVVISHEEAPTSPSYQEFTSVSHIEHDNQEIAEQPQSSRVNSQPEAPQKAETSYPLRAATALSNTIRTNIVGTFLGKRRGQIKTEQALLPTQRHIEQEVSELAIDLKSKEAQIRQAASERIQARGEDDLPQMQEQSLRTRIEIAEKMQERSSDENQENPFDAISRSMAAEAKNLHSSGQTNEHIGHMLMSSESRSTNQKESAETEHHPVTKKVENLSRLELIEISGTIEVEGTTLRKIYETHLIGEHALRRLVAEHLRGGDVNKALQREIVEHEIDFERDPGLRDASVVVDESKNESKAVHAPGKEALNQLLLQASANIHDDDDNLNYPKDPHAEAEKEDSEHIQKQHASRRKADIAMGSTILILVVSIIILYILRR